VDLDALRLSGLTVDGASGPAELYLPSGDYDFTLDGGSGPITVVLPSGGSHVIDIDAGSGPITLELPEGIDARFVVEDGSGPFSVGIETVEQVRGDGDEGVWQTPGYDRSQERLDVHVDMGSGPVEVEGR
jgi:hypothetical protein